MTLEQDTCSLIMVYYLKQLHVTVCVCLVCRLNMDVANLDGTSVAAALQTQIKAQLMEVTKQRTEVQHLQLWSV